MCLGFCSNQKHPKHQHTSTDITPLSPTYPGTKPLIIIYVIALRFIRPKSSLLCYLIGLHLRGPVKTVSDALWVNKVRSAA